MINIHYSFGWQVSLFPQWAVTQATLEAQLIHQSQPAFLSLCLLFWLEVSRLHLCWSEMIFPLKYFSDHSFHNPPLWYNFARNIEMKSLLILFDGCDSGHSNSCYGPPASHVSGTSSLIISARSVPWSVTMTTLIRHAPIWLALED